MPLVSKTFSQIITFTRASTATYFDATGTLQSAAIDAPRFDYDPDTLAARGFLIEEARTNSIRNNTMQGAVAGAPGTLPTNWNVVGGGLAANVIGTGTESGITYIDIQLVGTTSASSAGIRFEPTNVVVASSGQSWTGSFYARIVSGSITNFNDIRINLFGRTSSNAANADNGSSADFKSSLTASNLSQARRTHSLTLADATTAFISVQFLFGFASGVAIDITLRIGLPQLEQGAFATSVIPTTTTALTRSADVASVNTLSPWFNAAEGTVYAEAVGVSNVSGATRRFVEIGDGTSSDRFIVGYSSATNNRFLVVDGGVNQADVSVSTGVLAGSLVKMAAAYAVNDFQQASNGTLGTADTSGTLPTITSMYLGSDAALGAASLLNGYLRRITYYPRRLSNAELQGLTA